MKEVNTLVRDLNCYASVNYESFEELEYFKRMDEEKGSVNTRYPSAYVLDKFYERLEVLNQRIFRLTQYRINMFGIAHRHLIEARSIIDDALKISVEVQNNYDKVE